MKHQIQSRTLMEILADNKNTDYGRRYGFENIKTVEQFRNTLPITDYNDYAPLIALMTRLGEKDIFTYGDMACYTLSFGPDGSARYIPCTRKYIELYGEIGSMLSQGHVFSLCANLPKVRRFNDGMYLNTISGTLLTECAERTKGKFGASAGCGPFTSPRELIYPEGMFDHRYVRMLFALADEKVRLIIAPYTGIVLDSFLFLEENWEMLLDDLEAGTIGRHDSLSREFWLPENIKSRFAGKLKPNRKRASELRAIFKEGFRRPVAAGIWPQLALIVAEDSGTAGTGGDAKNDTKSLKRYTGNIPLNHGLYFSAEALIGTSVRNDCDERILLPDAGFFEFVPTSYSVSDKTRPMLMDALQVGGEYGIIVTNCLGFYRYKIGDIVRVVRMEGGVPVVNILYRSNAAIPSHRNSEMERASNIFRTVERELHPVTNAHC